MSRTIETKEFEFPAKDYFRLALRGQIPIVSWTIAYAAIVMFVLAIIADDWRVGVVGVVGLLIVIPIVSYLKIWYVAYSKDNRNVFKKRRWTFNANEFHVLSESGAESHGPLNDLVLRATVSCGYYCLFASKMLFYPLPFTAFESEEDRLYFEKEILADKFQKAKFPWRKFLIFLVISAILLGGGYLSRPAQDSRYYDAYEEYE